MVPYGDRAETERRPSVARACYIASRGSSAATDPVTAATGGAADARTRRTTVDAADCGALSVVLRLDALVVAPLRASVAALSPRRTVSSIG